MEKQQGWCKIGRMGKIEEQIQSLGEQLEKEALENPIPDVERCVDLLQALETESSGNMSLALLEATRIGKLLAKSIKSFKRHQRTASDDASTQAWSKVVDDASKLLDHWKAAADKEAQSKAKKSNPIFSKEPGIPKSTAEYRQRLVVQKKEIYKDPPVLPPTPVVIEEKEYPLPKRDEKTGILMFTAGSEEVKKMTNDFQPNRTPEEVLRAGSFGGTYFRPITSAVTNISYDAQQVLKDTLPKEWIEGLPMDRLTSNTYRPQVNKFGVKCGGSLGMWESSGWIVESDPYGWFQWYCRFYQGRRCSDDARQISRWLKSAGLKGRFRSQLCNKILDARTTPDDTSISPVIRQTLLHWGLEITPNILEAHRNRTRR